MYNTWKIMSIIDHFNNAVKNVKMYTKEYEDLEEKYAQAIRLQCNSQYSYGYIMTREDFIEAVRTGSFIDYDGQGIFLDWDGNKTRGLYCDVDYLEKFDHPFVAWFNK